MTRLLATTSLLVAGPLLALFVCRRPTPPPLWAALAVGVVLRGAAFALAATDAWQPVDYGEDFLDAAFNVLHHRDPLAHTRVGGWHFLPAYAYVLAGELKLGLWLNLPWPVTGRLVPSIADLALIPLIGRLAGGATPRERLQGGRAAFWYACLPLAVMVSALHGQIESLALLLGVAAMLAARVGRARTAGVVLGLAVAVNSWPVLLLPGILAALPGSRSRVSALAATTLAPASFFFTIPLVSDTGFRGLPDAARGIVMTRSVVGDWGWSTLLVHGDETVWPALGRLGTLLLVVALLMTWFWWHHADPLDLTAATLLVFCVVTHRLGSQYLLWTVPYLLARPTAGTPWALSTASAWAGWGYLWLSRATTDEEWWAWHRPWALASIAVLPFLGAALPWRRRDRREDAQTATGPERVCDTASTRPPIERSPG